MLRTDFIKSLLSLAVISPYHAIDKITYQKIYISQFFIAGFQYYDGPKLFSEFKVGDKLILVREPNNKFDIDAIALYWQASKIGFIPRINNAVLAAMLDANDLEFVCEITHLEENTELWENVAVAVSYLKEIKRGLDKEKIPSRRTKVKEPKYKTKKQEQEDRLIPLTSKPEYTEELVKSMNFPQHWFTDLRKFFDENYISVIAVHEIPEYIKKGMSRALRYNDRITDSLGTEYLILDDTECNNNYYEIFAAETIKSDDGKQFIKGIFKDKYFNMEWQMI